MQQRAEIKSEGQFLRLDGLIERVQSYIRTNSNYDTQRNYLGMSSIGRCPRELYNKFYTPPKPTDEVYRNCYLGYLWEDEAKDILEGAKIFKADSERELVASFDQRFVGHTDGETTDGNLLEIKSVTAYSLEKIKQDGRVKRDHFSQVQTYMRYGDYSQALVAYVSRDPMEFHFISVPRVLGVGERMEQKAKQILAAIDSKTRPSCECRHCN